MKPKFHNVPEIGFNKHSYYDLFKWRFTRRAPYWPKWVDLPLHAPLIERASESQLIVSFINHATVLIQTAGLNILTDPIWSARCSPFNWIGPKRVHAPGIPMIDLPPIDLVLISHDHYDHLDLPTVSLLHQQFKPYFFSGLYVSEYLHAKNKSFHTEDLNWWQTITVKEGVNLTFVPAQHWSRRGFIAFNRTLWGGFVLSTAKFTIYFSGDTGFGPEFQQIAEKFPDMTLAILPIGAYEPRWFMRHYHTNPEEAVMAHKILKARHSLGVHYNTFQLSDEGFNQPLLDLEIASKRHGLSEQDFLTLLPGQSWQFIEKNCATLPS